MRKLLLILPLVAFALMAFTPTPNPVVLSSADPGTPEERISQVIELDTAIAPELIIEAAQRAVADHYANASVGIEAMTDNYLSFEGSGSFIATGASVDLSYRIRIDAKEGKYRIKAYPATVTWKDGVRSWSYFYRSNGTLKPALSKSYHNGKAELYDAVASLVLGIESELTPDPADDW